MAVDLIGQRFDRLEVIGIYGKDKNGFIRWKCKCDCGNIIPCYASTLKKKNGSIKSCGCVYIDELRKHIGEKREFLEIIGVKQHGRKGRVVVKCVCGNEKEMTLSQFNNSAIRSCGCIGVPKGKDNPSYKHGMSRTRIYGVYRDIYNRCYNPNDISYPNYGARGIIICPEWLGEDGINNFSEWALKNGFDKNAKRGECTVDRIEVDKGYSPDNCRFVSMKIQNNNKGNNRYYEIDGVTKTLSEWCEECGGLCVQSVYNRLERGMDIKTALTKPMKKKVADMTEEELEERKLHRLEMDRKWRAEHKEQIRASREKWIRNNPDKNVESKKEYEEKKKLERQRNKE